MSFGVLDWIVFAVVPILTLVNGAKAGLQRKARATSDTFNLANHVAAPVLSDQLILMVMVVMSLFMVLGVPAQVYYTGATSILAGAMPGALCALFVTSFLLIPVLANPDTSSGDWLRYIKLRFTCPPLSATCTALVLISLSHIAGCLLNGLALALAQVSELGAFQSAIIVLLGASVYVFVEGKTCFIWSDWILAGLNLTSVLVALFVGLMDQGGLNRVIEKTDSSSLARGRPESAVDAFFGHFFLWTGAFALIFSSSITVTKARPAQTTSSKASRLILTLISTVALLLSFLLLTTLGAVLVASRSDDLVTLCQTSQDHLGQRWPDRIVIKTIVERFGNFYGLLGFPGLFLASVVAQTLSVISTAVNHAVEWTVSIFTEDSHGSTTTHYYETAGHESDEAGGQEAKRSTSSLTRQLLPRCAAAVVTLASGMVIILGVNETLTMASVVAVLGVIFGVLLAIVVMGLFVPYVTGRGATSAALIVLVLGHWIVIGGFVHSPPTAAPLYHVRSQLCGGVALPGGHHHQGQVDSSPHLPTAIQTAGRVTEKNAPGFLIPQRSSNHQRQSGSEDADDLFLPRSPVYSDLAKDQAGLPGPKLSFLFSSTGSKSAPSSPHVLSVPQLPANRNSNKAGSGSSQSGESGSSQQGSSHLPSSPGVMNKPPLVLAKPEEDPGAAGGSNSGSSNEHSGIYEGSSFSIYELSHHLYGIIAFVSTILLALLFSLRCPGGDLDPGAVAAAEAEYSRPDMSVTRSKATSTLDPRLIHPLAQALCCTCCSSRPIKAHNISISLEKRQSIMAAALDSGTADLGSNGPLQRHGSSRSRNSRNSVTNDDPMGLSRRCSRHSHMSKRSSLGSGHQQAQQGLTTTADVLYNPEDEGLVRADEVQRRLSQLSGAADNDMVEAVVASRRNSGSSGGFHRRLSPQMSLTVPPAMGPQLSPTSPMSMSRLAPPTDEELVAQRRFSEVTAAIERHNSRRKAKRSQSVMYRPQRRAARRRSTEMEVALSADRMRRSPNMAAPGVPGPSTHLKTPMPLQATLSAPPMAGSGPFVHNQQQMS